MTVLPPSTAGTTAEPPGPRPFEQVVVVRPGAQTGLPGMLAADRRVALTLRAHA